MLVNVIVVIGISLDAGVVCALHACIAWANVGVYIYNFNGESTGIIEGSIHWIFILPAVVFQLAERKALRHSESHHPYHAAFPGAALARAVAFRARIRRYAWNLNC